MDEWLDTPGRRLVGFVVVSLATAVLYVVLSLVGLGGLAAVPFLVYVWWWWTYVERNKDIEWYEAD